LRVADLLYICAAMKKLTTAMFLSVALFASACGGDKAAAFEKLSKEMCECKDKKCTEDVDKKMEAELETFKSEPSEATMKKIGAAMEAAGKCQAKILSESKEK
jgi:hypothetical protein